MNAYVFLLVCLLGPVGTHAKVAPMEAFKILSESDAVAIVTPGHTPTTPVVESVLCSVFPIAPKSNLYLPLASHDRMTESNDSYDGVRERSLVFLRRSGRSWTLSSHQLISLVSHKVNFVRRRPYLKDPHRSSGENELLLPDSLLLLPGTLVKGDRGHLSESALLKELKAEFEISHRRKRQSPKRR